MLSSHTARTTEWKLSVFRSCFTGLPQVYGTYDLRTGRARQVKAPVTDQVILRRLQGRQPYGVYLLMQDRTRSLALDFDEDDLDPPTTFLAAAKRHGIPAYLERSKSKGYHVWVFFEQEGVVAAKARRVVRSILSDMGRPDTEIFPKQDCLNGGVQYGNIINTPLFGRLVPQGRTVFVREDDPTQPCPDQWELLAAVKRVPESDLDALIEILALTQVDRNRSGRRPQDETCTSLVRSTVGPSTLGLPPCAQRMLTQGVVEYQRVACFRLAVHLKKAGLPRDIALGALITWAAKNRPKRGRGIITEPEIAEQTGHAYAKHYRGCGCEDPAVRPYCHPTCPLRQRAHERSSK